MSVARADVLPIVALDVADAETARRMVGAIGDLCRFYKVGSELFTGAGPEIVHWLREDGCDVFLDLKFHDIPATMRAAARAAAVLGARLMTVHASAGVRGVSAAVEGALEGAVDITRSGGGVLAVTALTSFTPAELATVWGRAGGGASEALDLQAEVARLSALAAEAGAHGIVCSGHEARAVRRRFGARLAPLVPGIRLGGSDRDDQARVMTPREAAEAGARYLVLGRTVTAAADPAAAMSRVHEELRAAARPGAAAV